MPPTFHIASLNCYTPKFCILRGVRILLSNCTEISATSETLSSVVPLAIFYKSACRFKSLEIHRRACTRCSMQNCRCKINHACWSRTHVCVHYVLNNQTIHQKFDHDRQGTPTSSKSFVNFLFMIYSIWQCDIVKNLYWLGLPIKTALFARSFFPGSAVKINTTLMRQWWVEEGAGVGK